MVTKETIVKVGCYTCETDAPRFCEENKKQYILILFEGLFGVCLEKKEWNKINNKQTNSTSNQIGLN